MLRSLGTLSVRRFDLRVPEDINKRLIAFNSPLKMLSIYGYAHEFRTGKERLGS